MFNPPDARTLIADASDQSEGSLRYILQDTYNDSLGEIVKLKIRSDPSAYLAFVGVLFILVASVAQVKFSVKSSSNVDGDASLIFNEKAFIAIGGLGAIFLFIGGLAFWKPIKPAVKIEKVKLDYIDNSSEGIDKLWKYAKDLSNPQNATVEASDLSSVYEGIATLASRQDVEKLKDMARDLSISEDYPNAGILYKAVTGFSEDEDIAQLKVLASELSTSPDASSTGIIYKKIVALSDYEDVAYLEAAAKNLLDLGKYKNAAEIYRGITLILDDSENASDSMKASFQTKYGFTLLKLKDNDSKGKAATAFRTVANYQPDKFDPYYYLCQLYNDIEEVSGSVDFCDEALRLDPGGNSLRRARMWYERGLLLDEFKEYDDALESFVFSYSILASDRGSKNEKIFKLNDAASVSSSEEDLNPSRPEDLEELSILRISEYDSFLTKRILAVIVSSEASNRIPVLSSNSTIGDSENNEVDQLAEGNKPINVLDSDFPLTSCGRYYEKAQHLDLYLVFVRYSKDNLRDVKSQFCQDAFRSKSNLEVQVASFAKEENADQLAKALKKKFGWVRVSSRQDELS
ncbi:MAG: hypothetical protein WA947_08725 [Phormidesmis sp.]